MGRTGSRQLIAVAGAVLLFCGMALMPRKKEEDTMPLPAAASSIENRIEEIKSGLDRPIAERILSFEKQIEKAGGNGKSMWLDSLALQYDRLNYPAASAFYYERKAEADGTEASWLNAAYRYFDSFKAEKESASRSELIKKAIGAYSKVLAINPANLNAKTDLGVCYTETPEPMKGIGLLREVITENPEHENAQLNLGILSMKSGQFDKAVERFKKVKEINPGKAEADLLLGEAYVRSGRKEQGIKHLEQYLDKSKDTGKKQEVREYISSIKDTQIK
jgi:tetratricopeptide (TPR) repeat protein